MDMDLFIDKLYDLANTDNIKITARGYSEKLMNNDDFVITLEKGIRKVIILLKPNGDKFFATFMSEKSGWQGKANKKFDDKYIERFKNYLDGKWRP